jgi:hypothetical protein
MILPGETEAGTAGMQPCRGIAWRADRDDDWSGGSFAFALFKKTHRIGRPRCLENPRPKGGILTNGQRTLLHFTLNRNSRLSAESARGCMTLTPPMSPAGPGRREAS